jgi:hypothetical protein
MALLRVLVCTRFVAFCENGASVCFWTNSIVRRVADPVDVVGHISDGSVLSVVTSTSAFSVVND